MKIIVVWAGVGTGAMDNRAGFRETGTHALLNAERLLFPHDQ
ncbi:hypothetical protein [Parablautia muri]|nr:hypothetical protein [Parablautia muri]